MTDHQLLACKVDWLTAATRDSADSRPYVGVHSVEVHVSDLDQSLQFYVEKLGFWLLMDARIDAQNRCVAVGPPDRSAVLALVKAPQTLDQNLQTGRRTGVTLVTDDIATQFKEWSDRGVHFTQTPTPAPWGIHATFEDIDGNQFSLLQSPWLVSSLNAERRAVEERREAERRAAHEMEIAKQVQVQLFPQRLPRLETLEYAGTCVQARQVGGDYYDFLDLGPGRLALVVGDIAGKGIAGALLMANLQATLRSHYLLALEDLPSLLQTVNRLLYENTPEGRYATLFFAEYEDRTRRLRYVNCGHLPALLLRRAGTLEQLDSNSTVLGMFGQWECAEGETELDPEDTLLLYTDGITEASSANSSEFGEEGLIGVLRAECHLPVEPLLERILEKVRKFRGSEQEDDMTLVGARCHPARA